MLAQDGPRGRRRRAPTGAGVRVARRGEEVADPVRVQVRVDEGRVVEVDEGGVGVGAEAEGLDAARQCLVAQFLLAAPVALFLVPARGVAGQGAAAGGDVDVSEAVGFDGLVVEPGAVARFPREAADHAELGAAAAGHVVAAFLELDGRGAVEAALPAFFLGDLDEFLRRGVFGAVAAGMPFVVAGAADFRLAPLAFAKLPASVGATARVDVDMCGFDPGAATPCGAVDAVFGRVLLKLSIPFSFEAVVEELVDVFEVDAIFCAACRWHMLWIGRGKGEDTAQAGVAHAVFAG